MKPELDKMTNLVVDSLSGEAREFYDREFGFFNEVTSISGKLKPYIKRSKPEKKVRRIRIISGLLDRLSVHHRRRLTKNWQRSKSKSASICLVILTVLWRILTESRVVLCKVTLR